MRIKDEKKPKKRAVNLTIREDILRDAKKYGINASETAQDALAVRIKKAKETEWLKKNKDAIAAHKARIENEGTFIKPIWADGMETDGAI